MVISGIKNPKKAALQGLKKMKLLMELGFPQGIFLPHERPHLGFLRDKGFKGNAGCNKLEFYRFHR